MRQTLLFSCVVLAGCVGGPEPDQPEDQPAAAPTTTPTYLVYEPEQGRHILGSFADTLAAGGYQFRVSVIPENQPAFQLSVNAAGLGGVNGTYLMADDGVGTSPDYTRDDPWFRGLILNGPNGQLRIRDAAQIGTQLGPVVLSTIYYLDYRSVTPGNIGPWVDYCPDGSGAIPLSGYYDSRRIHQPGSWISFACADGVAQKCNSWSYPAGNAGPGSANWDHHQACTAMANADYCRSGTPYTREKTPILVRDFSPVYAAPYPSDVGHPNPYPGDPDTYYFEAGWRPGGLGPVCLSKLRWASLPPNPCPTVLADPRYSNDDSAQFCDDLTLAQIQGLGAILVNGSKMMDAPLHRWRNPKTGDEVSTIRGYFVDKNGNGVADYPASIPPFPDYTVHLGTDGMLLRNLPGTLSETQMYPLYMQNLGGGDRYLSDVGGGRKDPAFEGYSFQSQTTTLTNGASIAGQAFSLCQSGGDLDTSLSTLGGCSFVKSLDYALPAP